MTQNKKHSILDELSRHQSCFQKAHESIATHVELFRSLSKTIQEQVIPIHELIKSNKRENFLLENGWFISPYMFETEMEDILVSDDVLKLSNKNLNNKYESFFCSNDYKELNQMIDSWQDCIYYNSRRKVFINCLNTLRPFRPHKRNLTVNPALIILPLLISQIDGILSSCAINNGFLSKSKGWRNENGKCVKRCEVLWRKPCSNKGLISGLLALDTYLFGTAFFSQKEKKRFKSRPFITFNRHKIMHGESLNFGTIDNVIRAFLILDFLAYEINRN